tara:strand:- start:239 stop:616 length:378 start_codon:yes stop_codon:yes gene_type:complete
MSTLTKKLKKNSSYRKVFRKARTTIPKNILRLAIESLILLLAGVFIYIFLQNVSAQNDVSYLLSSTFTNYYEAISSIYKAIKSTLSILLVIMLAFLCIIILLSSFWRIVKIISMLNSRRNKLKKF